jgi:hypothetical protein
MTGAAGALRPVPVAGSGWIASVWLQSALVSGSVIPPW